MTKAAITLVSVLALASFCATAAWADEAYDQCKAAPAADAKRCGEDWLSRETSALNAAFDSVIAQTDGAIADAMASEQTSWSEFYKASCTFMADTAFAPGGDTTTYFACKAKIIADRRTTIDAYTRYIDN